ncbi:hypothetical protein LTR12_012742 [Friedmanniomyces endolithicus]|nr:hypothetical protein LTR12_012742 [Friedmanniomyces endolithicus]
MPRELRDTRELAAAREGCGCLRAVKSAIELVEAAVSCLLVGRMPSELRDMRELAAAREGPGCLRAVKSPLELVEGPASEAELSSLLPGKPPTSPPDTPWPTAARSPPGRLVPAKSPTDPLEGPPTEIEPELSPTCRGALVGPFTFGVFFRRLESREGMRLSRMERLLDRFVLLPLLYSPRSYHRAARSHLKAWPERAVRLGRLWGFVGIHEGVARWMD